MQGDGEEVSIEELASNLATYKEQLHQVIALMEELLATTKQSEKSGLNSRTSADGSHGFHHSGGTFQSDMVNLLRMYKDKEHAEVEFMVGPIPIDDGIGKEVVTKFSTSTKSNKTFYSDSNGRDFLERGHGELNGYEE